MKKLLEILQRLSRELMGKIEKNELTINSANGIKLSGGSGISYEKAITVAKNYEAYKKESRQYWEDLTKIVIPKRIFMKLLEKDFSDLFLIHNMDNESKTRLSFDSKVKTATEKAPKIFSIGVLASVLLLVGAWFLLQPGFLPDLTSGEDGLRKPERIATSLFFLVISFVIFIMFYIDIAGRRKIKKAVKKFPSLYNSSFFQGGTDEKGDYYLKNNTFFMFEDVPYLSLSKIASQAINFGGKVGYIILKHAEIKSRIDENRMVRIYYYGKLLPVILLNETIILDTELVSGFYNQEVVTDFTKLNSFLDELFYEESFKLFL